MRYSASNYAIQAPIMKSNGAKIAFYVSLCVIVFVAIAVIAIGLGVEFGIGLKNKSSSLSSTGNCDYKSSTLCGCVATKPIFF